MEGDQILLGDNVRDGDVIHEQVSQTEPTVDELRAAPPVDQTSVEPWLDLQTTEPSSVMNLVAQLTSTAQTEYDKALALDSYFTNPANGFTYSVNAGAGDSANALTRFLITSRHTTASRCGCLAYRHTRQLALGATSRPRRRRAACGR